MAGTGSVPHTVFVFAFHGSYHFKLADPAYAKHNYKNNP